MTATSLWYTRGRRCHSRHISSVTLFPNQGNRRTVKVLAPSILPAKSSSTYLLIPVTIETTAMRNMTPIITPSRVKKLFSFCTRICWSASRMASWKGMMRLERVVPGLRDSRLESVTRARERPLLVPQRDHRVQLRRFRGWQHSEQNARDAARRQREHDGQRRHARGHRSERLDQAGRTGAQDEADDGTDAGERHRLDEELPEDRGA